jgi:hypothetical protein
LGIGCIPGGIVASATGAGKAKSQRIAANPPNAPVGIAGGAIGVFGIAGGNGRLTIGGANVPKGIIKYRFVSS